MERIARERIAGEELEDLEIEGILREKNNKRRTKTS